MKKVYVAHDPIDAVMTRDILMNSGIEAIVQGETLFGLRGAIPMSSSTLPTVWVVDDADFYEAEKVLDGYFGGRNGKTSKIKTWICRKCGEDVQNTMDSCWNCGNEKQS